MFNYYTEKKAKKDDEPKISSYAYGKDYHLVIKEKLRELLSRIKNLVGDVNGRVFVDSAPVMERVWAEKSGLGWIGKNTNLINKKSGSFFWGGLCFGIHQETVQRRLGPEPPPRQAVRILSGNPYVVVFLICFLNIVNIVCSSSSSTIQRFLREIKFNHVLTPFNQ